MLQMHSNVKAYVLTVNMGSIFYPVIQVTTTSRTVIAAVTRFEGNIGTIIKVTPASTVLVQVEVKPL